MSAKPATPASARLIIVDDEAAQMKALCRTLEVEGYETAGFTSASEALQAISSRPFDLLLTDLRMPEMDGITLLRAAHAIDRDVVGIVMTGHAAVDTAVEAMKAGALDYILKPFKLSVVMPVLDRALTLRRLRVENAQLEQSVRERQMALEAANKELEAFSYSVSHDLRAPLRTISGYSEILLSDHAGSLSAPGQRLLNNVRAGAQRMERLIEDLLSFSRLGRQPLSKQPVQIDQLARQVIEEHRDSLDGRDVDIRIDPAPVCAGDASLLKQVLANLLTNAIKFTRDRKPARIEVGSRTEGNDVVFHVRDNGAGFDMKYASKLFGVFQRLHSSEEFEGTGIGLSIVQRIVQRHGGRVWAEAQPGQGATFFFSLPAAGAATT
jgi:two-component system sensor histidine kinase/response regulator